MRFCGLEIGGLLLVLAMATGCGHADDAVENQRYLTALKAVAQAPSEGARLCTEIREPLLRADCITAAVEAIAEQDALQAEGLCDALEAGLGRDECFFQLAERVGGGARCAAAGRFEQDCRMHAWARRMRVLVRRGASPASIEKAVSAELGSAGFGVDDDRPWIGAFRQLHGGRTPLDRSDCDAVSTERLQGLCREAGFQLYNDRLNHARDIGAFPCDGQPLPLPLVTIPDPELEALVERRRGVDLCVADPVSCDEGDDCVPAPRDAPPEPG